MPAARNRQPILSHGTRLVQSWWPRLSLLALHSFPAGDTSLPLLSTLAAITFLSPGSREAIKSWLPGSALLSFGSWQPNKARWTDWPRQATRASLA